MSRLTTNKQVNEMGMFELAHNSCYIKDEKARYRDYDIDIDARELAIKLLDKFADIPNEFTCDDDFDEFIIDCLQYGIDSIEGLIALFYRNLWAMADLYEKLKKYEGLEEKKKLLKLKCMPGDYVWVVNKERNIISEYEVTGIEYDINNTLYYMWTFREGVPVNLKGFTEEDISRTVFTTREAAEDEAKPFI